VDRISIHSGKAALLLMPGDNRPNSLLLHPFESRQIPKEKYRTKVAISNVVKCHHRELLNSVIIIIIIAISGDRDVIKKEVEKILTYEDLTIEIQRMWNVKAKVIR
jgi:hypothetical protein